MERETELCKLFENTEGGATVARKLIDDIVFLEARLEELRELPFIKVNPKNPLQQKPTPAAKQYKELLQQYNNCIKTLAGILRKNGQEEESPLRAYLDMKKRELEE